MAFVPGQMMRKLKRFQSSRKNRPRQAGALGNLAKSTLDSYTLGERVVFSDKFGMPRGGYLIVKSTAQYWQIATDEGATVDVPTSMVLRRGTSVAAAKYAFTELTPEQIQARKEDCARAYAFVVTRNTLEQEAMFPTPMQHMTNAATVEKNAMDKVMGELEGRNMRGVHSSLLRSNDEID